MSETCYTGATVLVSRPSGDPMHNVSVATVPPNTLEPTAQVSRKRRGSARTWGGLHGLPDAP